ncbi:MAG: polyprenyl synthetase family protein, partial [Candidatus Omnitrophica bacterium]|nr:polyprenyl synthetase family protein [Candidatus Omnitrophota bacterium]
MLATIKKRIQREMSGYFKSLERAYPAEIFSPVLFRHIRAFLSRKAKRMRPVFFIVGYRGTSKNVPRGLYRSAVSVELLHNFVLIHDDIIDRSPVRRDRLSMHAALDHYLATRRHVNYGGRDLALIAGDILYALGIANFLAVKADPARKEAALQKLMEAAVYTGSGEFLELLAGSKNPGSITRENIYRIYDLKTGIYSFAAPLTTGALLAGAGKKDLDILYRCGIYAGRAFQIKDDIADIIGSGDNGAADTLADLRESRRTILIWYAYHNSGARTRLALTRLIEKKFLSETDLLTKRTIIIDSK